MYERFGYLEPGWLVVIWERYLIYLEKINSIAKNKNVCNSEVNLG